MSSHHIIRDNQEPALLLIHPEEVNETVIDALLEWAPLVICTEEALPFILKKGIKIDALLVEDVQLDWRGLLEYQWPVEIIDFSNERGLLQFILKRGIQILNMIGSFADLNYFDLQHLNEIAHPLIFNEHYKYHFQTKGNFEKWMSPGRGIIVRPLNEPSFVCISNAEEIGELRYQAIKEGIVSIQVSSPCWIGEVVI